MVNRSIQQKIVKRNRQRRAYLKNYSMKNTGPTVLPGFIGDDGKFRAMSLGSRNQAAQSPINGWLETKFGNKNPDHSPDVLYARRLGFHPDVFPAVVLAKVVQAERMQGEVIYSYRKLCDTQRHSLLLLMGGNEAFFLERTLWPDHGVQVYRRSIIYGDGGGDPARVRAMRAYLKDKQEPYSGITWVEKIQESLPPRPSSG